MISYTVVARDGGSKTYECQLCGASSPDLDAARAHHAVHVAGPELLAALKLTRESTSAAEIHRYVQIISIAAIEKAEPKG